MPRSKLFKGDYSKILDLINGLKSRLIKKRFFKQIWGCYETRLLRKSYQAPFQRIDDLTRESNFRSFRRQHRAGRLNIDDYVLEILDLFKFEPKKKCVDELEDTNLNPMVPQYQIAQLKKSEMMISMRVNSTNMDAASQATLFTEVTDEDLDKYLEQGHACSSSHQFHNRHH